MWREARRGHEELSLEVVSSPRGLPGILFLFIVKFSLAARKHNKQTTLPIA